MLIEFKIDNIAFLIKHNRVQSFICDDNELYISVYDNQGNPVIGFTCASVTNFENAKGHLSKMLTVTEEYTDCGELTIFNCNDYMKEHLCLVT